MVESLIDILAQRAGESPDREAFGFQELSVSYRQLWSGVRGYAGWLRAAGVQRNDTLLVALPNSPNFFEVFYGLQLAGGIPVPLFPGSGPGRLLDLAKRVGARRAVVSAGSFESIAAACPGMEILPDRVPEGHEVLDDILFERPTGEDLAFIQCTSGSSGAPKGVQITHSGLLTNLRQMIERMGFTERDIFVSWLPVYHDMGLILMTMAPFYLGCRLYLMPTSLMGLRDWIRAMAEVRATFTAAPDLAERRRAGPL
jgi:fatty-acyl-CoA synthase